MAQKKKPSSKKSTSSKQTPKESVKQGTCFIIMPFGEWFDYYFSAIYIPAIESAGLVPRRADDLYRPSAIVNDIWSLTQEAKVILADLSEKNPNVFYELGLAHALAKPAILVTESIEDVPFDLRSLRVIVYNKNEPDWGSRLKEKIETSINEVLESPLEAVLPTFIKVKKSSSSSRPTVSKAEKDLLSIKQDIDLLKRAVQSREERTAPGPIQVTGNRSLISFARGYLGNDVNSMEVRKRLLQNLQEVFGVSPKRAREILFEAIEYLNKREPQLSSGNIAEKTEQGEE